VAQHVGLWPEAWQGAASVIVPPIAVLLPALPRGVRWTIGRLRRVRARAIESVETAARRRDADRAPGAAEATGLPDAVPIEPASEGLEGDVGGEAFADGGWSVNPIVAAHLPDPTMWPWVPSADNDDAETEEADGDDRDPDAEADAPTAPEADNDDAARPTAV
jgi:hypothetical protein